LDCGTCRSRAAEQGAEVPCEATGRCPYTPDGEMEDLLPENVRAVWLWRRWQVFGPAVFDLIDWDLSADAAELLLEQLYTLETYSATLRQAQQG
jgi:hypothetical protein